MWAYEKKLQYPVKIKNPNPKLAQIIISQYGGPDEPLILWHIKLVSTYSRISSTYPEKSICKKTESKTRLSSTLLNFLHFFQLRGMGLYGFVKPSHFQAFQVFQFLRLYMGGKLLGVRLM